MIPVPAGVRVWVAVGQTDMHRGMNGLALQVQEALGRDPHAGAFNYPQVDDRQDEESRKRLTSSNLA